MSDKPSYLGLLNAVAVAEGRACEYLTAWAACTPSADVRRVLLTVAAREGEHAASFSKRVNELGYEMRRKADDSADKAIAIVTSDCSDLEKMETLNLQRLDTRDKPDVFDDFFNDHSIDIQTGTLLGRYIAEERDSARLLRSCYEQLKAADSPATRDDDRVASLERKVDQLCETIEQLCAAMPAADSRANGATVKARTSATAKARKK
jgi:rubrerythrin